MGRDSPQPTTHPAPTRPPSTHTPWSGRGAGRPGGARHCTNDLDAMGRACSPLPGSTVDGMGANPAHAPTDPQPGTVPPPSRGWPIRRRRHQALTATVRTVLDSFRRERRPRLPARRTGPGERGLRGRHFRRGRPPRRWRRGRGGDRLRARRRVVLLDAGRAAPGQHHGTSHPGHSPTASPSATREGGREPSIRDSFTRRRCRPGRHHRRHGPRPLPSPPPAATARTSPRSRPSAWTHTASPSPGRASSTPGKAP